MSESLTEEWRVVVGKWAGFPYEVSSLGNIRRVGRKSGANIAKHIDRGGYERVSLRWLGMNKNASVHKLVCEAFVAVVPDGMTVNHKNGNKRDNKPSNLEVMSLAENIRHAFRVLGRRGAGGKRIQPALVLEARRMHMCGFSIKSIATVLCIHRETASLIVRRKIWAHV